MSRAVAASRRFLADTGARFPVVCGPMYPGSNPELVAAVSDAGGFGVVQPISLTYLYGHDFRAGLRMIKALTPKPFGVNFTIVPNKEYARRMDEWIDISIDEGVKFFLTSLGKPDAIVRRAAPHGVKVYHDVHSVELARRAAGAGVSGLNLLNDRMGGQTGALAPRAFLDALRAGGGDAAALPLLCAGGVGGAADFAACLDAGYAGAQLGTRFLATDECVVPDEYKQALVRASEDDVVWTNKMAGTNSSVLRTPLVEKGGLQVGALLSFLLRTRATKSLARLFLLKRSLDEHKRAAFDGSVEWWQAGKGVGGIKSVVPAAAVVRELGAVFDAAPGARADPAALTNSGGDPSKCG